MSYTMDFIGEDEINSDDKIYDYSLSADVATSALNE